MCWAAAKYFHMGVEFTGSRGHWEHTSHVGRGAARDSGPHEKIITLVTYLMF